MNYAVLSPEQKADILRSRVLQHEAAHYNAVLDLQGLEDNAELPGRDEQIKAAQDRIADIERVLQREGKLLREVTKAAGKATEE